MSELFPIFVMFGHRPEHPGGNMAYLLDPDPLVKPEDDWKEESAGEREGRGNRRISSLKK